MDNVRHFDHDDLASDEDLMWPKVASFGAGISRLRYAGHA
jgi:hypothetical protein